MRQRLGRVLELEKDDRDVPMDAVVRRFWLQASPAPSEQAGQGTRETAQVVDLAQWARARSVRAPIG